MDFKELVSEFAARHNVSDLSIEDDTTALDIDSVPVTLVGTPDRIIISAEIGDPPVGGREAFDDLLLEANMETEACFAKIREGGKYIVIRRLPLAGLDFDAFDEALEATVNLAELWRRLLADFRPAAKASAENDTAARDYGTSGFIQV